MSDKWRVEHDRSGLTWVLDEENAASALGC
jgi:hypothetical protein